MAAPGARFRHTSAMSLAFRQIGHRFGASWVLRDVSFAAAAGKVTCLLGASGSGKSTLLRLAAGLEPVQTGSITLDGDILGAPQGSHPPERRSVGLVFQDHVLFPHLTVRDNVAFGLRERAGAERRRVVGEWLETVGLAALAERFPHTLSGGEQQRVALARALAPGPRALLLDEPFANIDVTLRRALREDTRKVLRDAGSVALVVTHDPEEALELADRVAVLHGGRIVQIGSPQELWSAPTDVAVAELFGQAQRLRGRADGHVISTRFGAFQHRSTVAAPATEVDLVARPAGVGLRQVADGPARVSDIRFLGDRYMVLVEADEDAAGGRQVLRASLRDLGSIRVGDRVVADFAPADTFVY